MRARRKILSVVGTRPNLMKIAPIAAALGRRPGEFEHVLVHTGQHYDVAMSQVFFDELGLPAPDHLLAVGSGSHGQQTARVIERIEPVLEHERPDVVLVPGDVNSTMAAAVAAAKAGFAVGHVEAGLRSRDWSMPEEINRVVADSVSSLLFTHSPEARANLLAEGHAAESIHDVGNTMIDTLVAMRDRIARNDVVQRLGLSAASYLVVTLHRPALVDTPLLSATLRQLDALARELDVVFPAHPRTRAALARLGVSALPPRLRLLEPLGYLDFLALVSRATAVLTDSGGIQEETTFLGIPCFTLRDNTERPVTVELGTNVLLGLAPERIAELPQLIAAARAGAASIPPLWDGKAAERVAAVLSSSQLDMRRRS